MINSAEEDFFNKFWDLTKEQAPEFYDFALKLQKAFLKHKDEFSVKGLDVSNPMNHIELNVVENEDNSATINFTALDEFGATLLEEIKGN